MPMLSSLVSLTIARRVITFILLTQYLTILQAYLKPSQALLEQPEFTESWTLSTKSQRPFSLSSQDPIRYTAGRAPNPLLDGFSGTWETGLKDLLPANPKYTKTQIGTVTSGRMFA